MNLAHHHAVMPVALLLSMSAAAHGPSVNPPTSAAGPSFEPTMVQVSSPDKEYAAPYACYRVKRCSAYDLYTFAGRPNWLTRRAPEAPAGSDQWPLSIEYEWFFAPVTPAENILPKYRAASQVRDEYHAVGRPID